MKPFAINFCYDTTYKLVTGCNAVKCIIDDVRIAPKEDHIPFSCDIKTAKRTMKVFCMIVQLSVDTYFISLQPASPNLPKEDPFKGPRWGEWNDYILGISADKVKILQERHLIVM